MFVVLFSVLRRPPGTTLFPYTTLFRSTSKTGRAGSVRSNLLFELGFLSGRLGLERTLIVITDPDRTEIPSDLTESDRKSTRLNSSHSQISYAVFCLKKKKNIK